MRRVYQGENLFDAQLVRDRLLEDGIAAEVHGIMLAGAVGEIPADTRPSVWIDDADLYQRARQLIERFEQSRADAEGWRCPECGEDNGPAFESCWACGALPSEGKAGNRE